jgi:HEAT repeat protein
MLTQRRKLLLLGAVALAAAGVGIVWTALSHREPVYHGKSLTAWMDQMYRCQLSARTFPELAKAEEARTAIHEIGTNALPSLIRMVRARDSQFKKALLALAANQSVFGLPFKSADYYHNRATWCFRALGRDAKPAFPALIELLHDPDRKVQASAATCLCMLGPEARDAVPALVQTLERGRIGDGPVLIEAMLALGAIHSDPEAVLPVLLEYVNGSRKDWNYSAPAMDALGRYREQARSTVPAILPYLKDPDQSHSSSADAALCKIDPRGTEQARRKALGL